MTAHAHVVDVTAADFDQVVLAGSHERPVLVDFWAPWCAPCRGLAPILERVAAESAGAFLLAKLDTDAEGAIAQRYGIRGIPNVKAFVDGRVADEFSGALPEQAVREFVARLVPGPVGIARRAARDALAAGRFDEAETTLRRAIEAASPDDRSLDAARIDLAGILIARGDFERAEPLVAAVSAATEDDRYATLAARIESWRATSDLPSTAELEARVAEDPEASASRLQLAERLIAEMRFEAALESLLAVVRANRGASGHDTRENARKAMLRTFTLAADEPELVGRYRRLLAAALN